MSTIHLFLGLPVILVPIGFHSNILLGVLMQYCAGDKIEKNEMGWACGSYGGGEGGV